MKFRLMANATFDAEGIDDAFKRLAEHFNYLYGLGLANTKGEGDEIPVETERFFESGSCVITKWDETDWAEKYIQ